MKALLLQDVPNLGQQGEMHEVSPGYFRNYLQPRGLASEATKGKLRAQQVRTGQQKEKANRAQTQTMKLADQIAAITLTFPVKVGEQGRLYGSITARDIAEALQQRTKVSVDRHKIALKEPLRALGQHTVAMKLEHGVEAHVKVDLVPETQEAG